MARGDGADFNIPFEKRLLSIKNIKNLLKIRKILKAEGFDAIILNTNLAAFIIRLALPKRLKKTTKVINFVHGYLFSRRSRAFSSAFFLLCEMLVRQKCDTVITMNSEDYRTAIRYRLARGRVIASRGVGIRPMQNFLPPEKIRDEYFPSARYVIAFVGELSKRKNQVFLIKCLPRIRRVLGDVRLCLVGDGRERDRLLRLVRRLSLEDAVQLLGYREDAADFIRACDLYVSPSLSEGMPLNVIEAMTLGKTALVSRIKGHRDLISDGVNGYLYDPFDMEEFTSLSCRILISGGFDPAVVRDSASLYTRSGALFEILSIFWDEIGGI